MTKTWQKLLLIIVATVLGDRNFVVSCNAANALMMMSGPDAMGAVMAVSLLALILFGVLLLVVWWRGVSNKEKK